MEALIPLERTSPCHPLVLIVDDDASVRDALIEFLEGEGYAVKAAQNGREALTSLHGGLRPGVILLDLMMPVMNGWDFRGAQLAAPALMGIPVIVMSATGSSRTTVQAHLPGVGFIKKPPTAGLLLDCVGRVCATAST